MAEWRRRKSVEKGRRLAERQDETNPRAARASENVVWKKALVRPVPRSR